MLLYPVFALVSCPAHTVTASIVPEGGGCGPRVSLRRSLPAIHHRHAAQNGRSCIRCIIRPRSFRDEWRTTRPPFRVVATMPLSCANGHLTPRPSGVWPRICLYCPLRARSGCCRWVMSTTTPVSPVSESLRSPRWPRQTYGAKSSRVFCVSSDSVCPAASCAQIRAQISLLTCWRTGRPRVIRWQADPHRRQCQQPEGGSGTAAGRFTGDRFTGRF